MKNFFPLKFTVLFYSFIFLTPLMLILRWAYTPHLILKIILIVFMVFVFKSAWDHYQYITLAPFLSFCGLFIFLNWYSTWYWVSFLFSFFLLFQFFAKFKQIDKIHDIYNERHERENKKDVAPIEIIKIAKEEYWKQVQRSIKKSNV